ncbi:MAG: succinate dehydrogenase, cytochrome b556 subunit [Alphaproteobacteria bacterium]|nr:succinate dehydrogenase, cytochrome b556 subunit [Alphaproteobacteria bacterium]
MSLSKQRPLSPHLQVYKWQITSVLSILHRFTGIGFCAGIIGLILWLYFLGQDEECYLAAFAFLNTLPGQIILWAVVFSGNFHFGNGIRHLVWDAGYGFSMLAVNASGWFVVGFSFLSTLFLFLSWR